MCYSETRLKRFQSKGSNKNKKMPGVVERFVKKILKKGLEDIKKSVRVFTKAATTDYIGQLKNLQFYSVLGQRIFNIGSMSPCWLVDYWAVWAFFLFPMGYILEGCDPLLFF